MIKTEINTPSVQVGFDAFSYFRDLTKHNKLTSELGFMPTTCSSPLSFEGMLQNMAKSKNFVVIDDTNEGNVAINGDGSYRKVITYTVWILMRYKEFDMNDRQEKLNTCRKIFRQFLSKIVIDKYDWQLNDFTYLLSDQVDNREIGAYFINGLTGVEFHIDVSEPLDLVYNNEEWNE